MRRAGRIAIGRVVMQADLTGLWTNLLSDFFWSAGGSGAAFAIALVHFRREERREAVAL